MFLLISFLVLLFLLIFIVVNVIILAAQLMRGALYVPTKPKKVKKMIELAHIKDGERAIDLGSGDGRIVIALAEARAKAVGFEISPFLVWLARKNIKKAKTKNASIYWKSFWNENFREYDVVTLFGMNHIMRSLEKKLKNELKPGARVVSCAFKFPTWELSREEENIYLYEQK